MATQKGRNWSSGDIVTAANLSSIERGVSAVAEEYTPTIWANGNTVTAAALNNIEQGITNAGGGSSDFSTATVTLVNNTDGYAVLEFPKVASLPSGTYTTASSPDGDPHATEEVVIALAEDGCVVLPVGITGNIAVSGDATIGDRGMIIITGDCTITIS